MTDEHRSPSQLQTWKPVLGYEGIYEVSSVGCVRSLDRYVYSRGNLVFRRGKSLKTPIGGTGYRIVNLNLGGVSRQYKVHRLVAEAFLAPSANPWVCHKDGDCLNNLVENLYWGTGSDNAQDRVSHGNHFQLHKTSCPKGHEYTPENTYVHRGGRSCKECRKDALRRFRKK